jgi:membrane-bound lytic murein transglycosylase D
MTRLTLRCPIGHIFSKSFHIPYLTSQCRSLPINPHKIEYVHLTPAPRQRSFCRHRHSKNHLPKTQRPTSDRTVRLHIKLPRILLIILLLVISACATQGIEDNTPGGTTHQIKSVDIPDSQPANFMVAGRKDQSEGASTMNTSHAKHTSDTTKKSYDYEDDVIWTRLRAGFNLPSTYDHPKVKKYLSWYRCHRNYLQRVTVRAEPYLYFILEEVERRGLPSELALLPVIESGYVPFAYSHGRAAGLWQFIPETAHHYGLKQNWWYDGRRDIYASTHAALDYLTDLNKRFNGNWLLALAAYNAGPLRVSRAIALNQKNGKPTDYWNLKLPVETLNYIPKLLAVKAIAENPQWTAIALWPIDDTPVITRAAIDSQIDLALAAQLADMGIESLYRLNPGFNHWATDPEGPHDLLLPIEKVSTFRENLAAISIDQRLTWVRHKIGRRDTLSHIAHKYHTTVAFLKRANDLHDNRIRAGRHLIVPTASKPLSNYTLSLLERRKQFLTHSGQGHRSQHIVRSGESFWSISRKYGVTVKKLTKWNAKAPGDTIIPGDKLVIWLSKPIGEKPTKSYFRKIAHNQKVRKILYSVKQGDSLYRIAKRFRVNVNDLRKWNDLSRSNLLHPRQNLTIYVDVTKQSSNI